MFGYIIAGIIGGLIAKNSSNESSNYYANDVYSYSEGWLPCSKCQPNEELAGEKWKETGHIIIRSNSTIDISVCHECGMKFNNNDLLRRYGY